MLIDKSLLAATLRLFGRAQLEWVGACIPMGDEGATYATLRHRASFSVHLRGTDCARADDRRLLNYIVG